MSGTSTKRRSEKIVWNVCAVTMGEVKKVTPFTAGLESSEILHGLFELAMQFPGFACAQAGL